MAWECSKLPQWGPSIISPAKVAHLVARLNCVVVVLHMTDGQGMCLFVGNKEVVSSVQCDHVSVRSAKNLSLNWTEHWQLHWTELMTDTVNTVGWRDADWRAQPPAIHHSALPGAEIAQLRVWSLKVQLKMPFGTLHSDTFLTRLSLSYRQNFSTRSKIFPDDVHTKVCKKV